MCEWGGVWGRARPTLTSSDPTAQLHLNGGLRVVAVARSSRQELTSSCPPGGWRGARWGGGQGRGRGGGRHAYGPVLGMFTPAWEPDSIRGWDWGAHTHTWVVGDGVSLSGL